MKEREGIEMTEKVDSEGFRRWYVTSRITVFLHSVHRQSDDRNSIWNMSSALNDDDTNADVNIV
jgi:hypothetical protein